MRWTIRAKLTALVLVVLLPLVAGAGLKFWHDLSEERAKAQSEMLEFAQHLARHLDEVLSGQFENLEALGSVQRLDEIESEELATLAARVQVRHPFIHRFLAMRSDGLITASSAPRGPEPAASFSDRALLEASLRDGLPMAGAPQPSAADGRMVVPLVAPILNRDAQSGLVVAEIDLRRFSAFIDGVRLSHGTTAAIVTADGIVLARSGGALKTLGQPFGTTPQARALIQRGGGISEWRWDDGIVSLAGAAPMSRAPWIVVAATPSAEAYGPAASRLWGNLLGLGAITLIAVLGAWLISRRMNRSVRALSAGARGLAAGDGPPIVVPTGDELAELAEQFNHAMDEQRVAQAGIEARQRRLRALADVNLSLSQQLDLERLLQQITEALARLTGAFVVVLWEVRPATGRIVRRTFTAEQSITVELPEELMLDEGGTGWIARHDRPLFVEDITRDTRIIAVDWALRNDLVAFAGVPVSSGGELLGVLTLNLKRGTLPPEDDRALLVSFASQAAVAIRNARLFAEAESRRREGETLNELSHALAQALDPDIVAQRIADGVRGMLRARSAGLYRLEDDGSMVAAAVSGDMGPTAGRGIVFPRGTGVASLVARDRAPIVSPNLLTDARIVLTPDVRARIEQAGYRSVLSVPLLVKDAVIGALSVGDAEGRRFTEDEVRLAQAFADHAAVTFQNARLYTEANRRRREAEALARMARALTESLDVTGVAERIVKAVSALFAARSAVIRLRRPDGSLVVLASSGSASEQLPPGHTLPVGIGISARAVAEGRAVWSADVNAAPGVVVSDDLRSRNELSQLGAVLAVPLRTTNEIIGMLAVADQTGRVFSQSEAVLLQTFADQAALALENARHYSEAKRRQHEAEELARVGRMLTESLDVADLGERIVASLLPLFGVTSSRLCLRRPDGALEVVASKGMARGFFDPGSIIPPGVGVVGEAMRVGRPAWTRDVLVEPRFSLNDEARRYVEHVGDNAVLAVPLTVKGDSIGALILNDRAGREFLEPEVALLQAFADQAALALDNARLYGETRQRLRYVDSLREVVEQILVPFSLDERLSLIARKAAELFDADRAMIALRDESSGDLVVRAGFHLSEGEVGRVLTPERGASAVSVSQRRPIMVNDYAAWPQCDPYIVTKYAAKPPQATMACPLLIRDQAIGALSVGLHRPDGRFTAADVDQLASLAAPAALAIEHSRLYAELQARLRELQETQAQLLQAGKLSAVGQLVSGVAHELNNPLSVVIGYGQLLMAKDLPPELRRPIELIVAQGDRMAKIVQSLLLFSRQRKPERGAVNLRDVIEQAVGLRATQLTLSGIHVDAAYGNGLPQAEGDEHQLQQVFLNLLLNAEQAILGSGAGEQRAGDRIRLSTTTRREGDQAWLIAEVADNGPGIPTDVLPRIFEPFFTTKRVGVGTGLGLSVSYGIIQQHGGRLSVASQPGRTVFSVELPAMAAPASTAATQAVAAPAADGRGRHALVVDDEPSIVDLVTTLLRQRGWQVDVAPGGRSALERLRDGRYDLVVTDIRMPDGSGEELYRAATSHQQDLAGRFVFITGDTANADAWRFLEATRAPVIEKPFTALALLQAVERVTP
jgi:GAF domain-containing protein/CheY-like chemotaxis protein